MDVEIDCIDTMCWAGFPGKIFCWGKGNAFYVSGSNHQGCTEKEMGYCYPQKHNTNRKAKQRRSQRRRRIKRRCTKPKCRNWNNYHNEAVISSFTHELKSNNFLWLLSTKAEQQNPFGKICLAFNWATTTPTTTFLYTCLMTLTSS